MVLFNIENGQNIIFVAHCDIGSYFRFNTPLSVVWYDGGGSIGKYFRQAPYSEEYREEVRKVINDNRVIRK